MSDLVTVVPVIKLKTLANELTATEFDQFLSKITRHIGKDVILKLLCSTFIKSTSINNHESLLNDMIKIISNIIQSRKIKEIKQQNIAKIDQMPSSLIGKISSYLPQNNYSLFSRLNRKIFVSCNTPNTLQKMELDTIKSYKSIKLQNYPQIKYLSFRLSQFTQFPMNNESISSRLRRLQAISINGKSTTNKDIQYFINQNSVNLTNLKAVHCEHFNIEFTALSQLLSQFEMIQHLHLWRVKISGQVDNDTVCQLFPDLTELSVAGSNTLFVNTILTHYGSNLECLWSNERNFNYHNVNFNKLRRLLVFRITLINLNGIMKTAKQLKEIVFAPYSNRGSIMNNDEIKTAIKKIIFDQPLLEFLYISTKPDSFEAICNSLETALYKTNKRKRENFEIILEINCHQKFDAADFMINISRIINNLIASNTNNFIIRFESNNHGEFNFDAMLKAINNYIQFTSTVKLIKSTKLGFIIGNKQCKMKMHNQWWHQFGNIHFYQ